MDRQPAFKSERQPSASSDEFEMDIVPSLASAFPRSTLSQLHGFVRCNISHLINASQGDVYFTCIPALTCMGLYHTRHKATFTLRVYLPLLAWGYITHAMMRSDLLSVWARAAKRSIYEVRCTSYIWSWWTYLHTSLVCRKRIWRTNDEAEAAHKVRVPVYVRANNDDPFTKGLHDGTCCTS